MYQPRERKLVIRSRFARRGIYWLPNMFTIAALFAGFYAIVQAMGGRYEQAAIAIFVAMVLDGLDGRVARLTHTQSAFGAELDSLATWSPSGSPRRWWSTCGRCRISRRCRR